jgi:hypothetical protein
MEREGLLTFPFFVAIGYLVFLHFGICYFSNSLTNPPVDENPFPSLISSTWHFAFRVPSKIHAF